MTTKKTILTGILLASILAGSAVLAGNWPANTIIGTWLVPKEDAKITISKCGAKYCGQISWLKTPEDLDVNNPDKSKRTRKILGLDILKGFVFDDGEWSDGKIYDPDTGNTYKCKMWMESKNKLAVKGYVGISLFGRSEVWTRTK